MPRRAREYFRSSSSRRRRRRRRFQELSWTHRFVVVLLLFFFFVLFLFCGVGIVFRARRRQSRRRFLFLFQHFLFFQHFPFDIFQAPISFRRVVVQNVIRVEVPYRVSRFPSLDFDRPPMRVVEGERAARVAQLGPLLLAKRVHHHHRFLGGRRLDVVVQNAFLLAGSSLSEDGFGRRFSSSHLVVVVV